MLGLLSAIFFVSLCPVFILTLLCVVLLPFTFGGWLPGLFKIGELDFQFIDILIIGIFLKQLFMFRMKLSSSNKKIIFSAAAFLLSYFLSVFYQYFISSPFSYLELVSLLRFSLLFVFFFSLMTMDLDERRVKVLRMVTVGYGVVCAVTVIAQYFATKIGVGFGYSVLYKDFYGRYSGIIGDPNQASAFMAFYVFYFMLNVFQTKRTLDYVCLILVLVAILLTGTRGPLLMLLTGLAVLFVLEKRKLSFIKLVSFLLPVVMVLSICMPSTNIVFMRTMEHDIISSGIEGRLQPIIRSYKILLKSPILGVGYSGHRFYARKYIGTENGGNINGTYNQYMETLVNGGILSFILYILMIVFILRFLGRKASDCLDGGLTTSFNKAAYYYLISMFLFFHTDLWLLPAATPGYLTFLIIAIVDRQSNADDLETNSMLFALKGKK